ncbi:MAG TPA: NAD-dependent protein deacylase [Clostridiales bacterium]|nr:MAG: NAD-dependent protein deacetylase [Firmicutes bacterium ADurb.Bin262]HOU10652.1 NAD-dependent protein deacylase [Clostridiales bacterium]HQH62640.1 NAD-dependent protein deacylase [Clostridiales bacterium]HQK72624.1 NAD-dependent protein deacylase [Clostridiales bacterium]
MAQPAGDTVSQLARIIENSRSLVFFGGAGVSTASGIPDFRGAGGLYTQPFDHPPEKILSHDFFIAEPETFFRFYRERMVFTDAKPNGAHLALAALERRGVLSAVITQNIDGLHADAGSRKVLELHGSVRRNFCTDCAAAYPLETVLAAPGVPRCSRCGGIIKPDVVLYGEALDGAVTDEAVRCVDEADTLLVGGTSLSVYPAAGLLHYFRGSDLVIINQSPTPFDGRATLLIRGDVAAVLSAAAGL